MSQSDVALLSGLLPDCHQLIEVGCKLIINLVDDGVEFGLNWIVFELLTAEFQQTLSVEVVLGNHRDGELWVCDMNFHVVTAGIRSGDFNDIGIVVVKIRLTLILFIRVSGSDIGIKE